jgi:RNA polymerase sigma factor (sigma-70 family)
METYNLLKHNKEKGIQLLFELYSKKLLVYASRTWNMEQDAAWDLIYKTIYRTADVIHQYEFQNEQKFASFIFKIFINLIRDHLRKTKTTAHGVREVELNEFIINNHRTDSTEKASPSHLLKMLENELSKLEDWQRILLLLRSQDMPYSDIAKYVDKPEKQLKVYYARLKQQLTESMQKIVIKKNANVE